MRWTSARPIYRVTRTQRQARVAFPALRPIPRICFRPYQGYSGINENETSFWDTYHSIQFNANRRFSHGFSLGLNYTWGISLKGNTGIVKRLQHAADGTIAFRSDEAQWEALNESLDARPHLIKANGIWSIPAHAGAWRLPPPVDQRLAGFWRYDLGFGSGI